MARSTCESVPAKSIMISSPLMVSAIFKVMGLSISPSVWTSLW